MCRPKELGGLVLGETYFEKSSLIMKVTLVVS